MASGGAETGGQTGRLLELDALRGVAALLVLVLHYTAGFDNEVGWHGHPPLFRLSSGHLGIALFFVISGFVIAMTLERSRNGLDFAVGRFARLYPTFWTCALITTGAILVTGFNPFHLTVPGFAATLTMLNGLTDLPFVDPSYWTLTRELLFYAFLATAYFTLGPRALTGVVFAWMVVTALYNVFVMDENIYACRTAAGCGGILLNATFAHLFALGVMGYKIHRGERTPFVWITLAAAAASGSVYLWPLSGFQPMNAVKSVLYLGLVLLAAEGLLRVLRWRVLVFFGTISYALYLLHQVIGYALIGALVARGLDPNLAILAAFALATALAAAVCFGVERPAQRAIRRAYAVFRARGPSAALAPVAQAGRS
ncbi:acyltransferase family protein [Methylobacterium organophilum]|uniref:Acyltransferase 3 domain-containing protein n=1 Tax=Methylobacterium organophilum TaxID=410 RepID=A0ABQ4T7N0_METOR|nr:acyltransferase [Methylobacterium organophilum]GJE27041.1 hypothetical protein LKMONMHP_1897 [Methylobacterium organophilum]